MTRREENIHDHVDFDLTNLNLDAVFCRTKVWFAPDDKHDVAPPIRWIQLLSPLIYIALPWNFMVALSKCVLDLSGSSSFVDP